MRTYGLSKIKGLVILKIALLIACLCLSLYFLQLCLCYSIIISQGAQSRAANTVQLLTIIAYIFYQLLGGITLRNLIGSDAIDWTERIKSVFLFSIGFFLITGLVGMVLVYFLRKMG
jgi:hypothetical protein